MSSKDSFSVGGQPHFLHSNLSTCSLPNVRWEHAHCAPSLPPVGACSIARIRTRSSVNPDGTPLTLLLPSWPWQLALRYAQARRNWKTTCTRVFLVSDWFLGGFKSGSKVVSDLSFVVSEWLLQTGFVVQKEFRIGSLESVENPTQPKPCERSARRCRVSCHFSCVCSYNVWLPDAVPSRSHAAKCGFFSRTYRRLNPPASVVGGLRENC